MPMAILNTYPLYSTEAAALADTAAVNGVPATPLVLSGPNWQGGQNNWIKYYMPQRPISTGGLLCMDLTTQNALGAPVTALKAASSGVRVAVPNNLGTGDAKTCSDLIYSSDQLVFAADAGATSSSEATGGGGRRLLAHQRRQLQRAAAAGGASLFATQVNIPSSSKAAQPARTTGALVTIMPQTFGAETPPATSSEATRTTPPSDTNTTAASPPPPVAAVSPPPPVATPSPSPAPVAAPTPSPAPAKVDKTTRGLAIAAIAVGSLAIVMMLAMVVLRMCGRKTHEDGAIPMAAAPGGAPAPSAGGAQAGMRMRHMGSGLKW